MDIKTKLCVPQKIFYSDLVVIQKSYVQAYQTSIC